MFENYSGVSFINVVSKKQELKYLGSFILSFAGELAFDWKHFNIFKFGISQLSKSIWA